MSALSWQQLDFDELDDDDIPDVSIDGLIELLSELGPIPAWTRDALCAEPAYRDLPWFPERGQTSAEAAEVCGRCQRVAECAAWADETGVKSGVWAGVNYGDRKGRTGGAVDAPTVPLHGRPSAASSEGSREDPPMDRVARLASDSGRQVLQDLVPLHRQAQADSPHDA